MAETVKQPTGVDLPFQKLNIRLKMISQFGSTLYDKFTKYLARIFWTPSKMGNEEAVEKPPKKKHAQEPEYESHCRMCKPAVNWRKVQEGNSEYVVYDIGEQQVFKSSD